MIEKRIIDAIRSSRFKTLSDSFIRVNRIAYVDAKLWEDYSSKSDNPQMAELSRDALKEMTVHIDKSIHVLAEIEKDAKRVFGTLKTAKLNGSDVQGKLSDALKYYVKIEKDWQKANDLADAIERSGVAGQEDVIRSDLKRLFDDIAISAKMAIDILVTIRSKALDELGA